MSLRESGEMYLETILLLSKSGCSVRSLDIAEEMEFSKPSVSRAVGLLKSGGYITVDSKGGILLTDSGREIAEKTYERHTLLTRFFEVIGVSPDTATTDACRIEHVISDETFEALKRHAGVAMTVEAYQKGK